MIGIFAGSGSLPQEIFMTLDKIKIRYIVFNLSNKKIKNSIKIQLGQFGKILKILKENKINNVIFAGYVKRPNLSSLKFDFKAVTYLPKLLKVFRRGDGNILNFAAQILKKNKIKVIDSHKFCKHLLVNKTITKSKPSSENIRDLYKGKKILDALSKFDNAQGVILDNGYVMAIESAEGTDEMLKRVIKLRMKKKNRSGVLIKLPKKKT
ncbi:MAG: UDP-2,3-diacylglucosamine diphosphatase LpxI domain-containing protein [Pelagibacteraceae bacterium]